MTRDTRFRSEATALGYAFDGEIKIGGNYVPVVRDQNQIFVSGQIPRVGNAVVVTGAAGAEVDEVADGASEVLYPKGATVELDLIASVVGTEPCKP